jgi:hypothetical protein
MKYSAKGLLELAATGAPITASQAAAAVDSPKERSELRLGVQEVSALRRSGAMRDARQLAKELSTTFTVEGPEDDLITGDPGELADAVAGVRPAPPASGEVPQPDSDDPAELASSILDRHQR